MNQYSHNYKATSLAFLIIILISAVTTYVINFLLKSCFPELSLMIAPSMLMVVGVISYLFDKHIWKLSVAQKILGVPIVSGLWVGTLSSESRSGISTTIDISIRISQSFFFLSVVLTGPRTVSYSTLSALTYIPGNRKSLQYMYRVEVLNITSEVAMMSSDGAASIEWSDTEGRIDGKFFTEQGSKGSFEAYRNKG